MWNPSSSKLWIWLASRTWKVRNSTEALYVHCDACNLTRLICHHGEMSLASFNKIKNRVKHEIYKTQTGESYHIKERWIRKSLKITFGAIIHISNTPISQMLQCSWQISHNAPFCSRNVHNYVTKLCIMGSRRGALWDLWDWSIKTLNVRGPSYLGLTRSISWLLMPWLLTSQGHQQPWYWLCSICRSWSYLRMDFK